jgi:hypothetical protein
MNNALRKIQTQHVPQLQATLRERRLPASVVREPARIVERGVDHKLKPRLELGLTAEPVVTQGAATSIEVRGNANSKNDARVHISANAGNINGVVPVQHVQVTTDNAPPPTTPAARPYRDPRVGIQLTDQSVVQWRNRGTSTNAQVATGAGSARTFTPVSPGIKFRGEKLPAGTHLVTSQSGPSVTMNFHPTGAFNTVANATKTRTYLLVPKENGNFAKYKLTAQELTDLKASAGQRSFTVKEGSVEDNPAPGYSQESLRAGGFVQ